MIRRIAIVAFLSALILVGLLPASVNAVERPSSMAATGDSITRAFNLCFFPFTDCPARSWSTGSNSTVQSHAYRLGITASAHNDARSGAKMSDLPGQATTVFNRNVGYVTVLMGGNDVCTDAEALMTTPDFYEAKFREAMNTLAADASPPLVYVVSVPNVKMLWEILKDSSSARSAWSSFNICQSLLANPLSMTQADVDRRERVKQRNMELNQRLRRSCAAYTFCRFDGEASFGTAFAPGDVSTRDYFHPSTAGQTKLASVSYNHGYWGTRGVNDAPVAAYTPSCDGLTCTFTDSSSDPQGVTGWSWNFDATASAGPTSVARNPTYTFSAAGTYTVALYAIDAAGATARVSQTVSVTDSGGGGSGTGTLSGTVTDASTSGAIGGAAVSIDGTTLSTTTDGSGNYSITGVPVGSYTVTASATGYESLIRTAATSEDVATDLDFALTLSGSGEVTMHVADLDGTASSGKGQAWTATVAIRIVDQNSLAVGSATVTGDWSTGGSSSCSTSAEGTCSVSVSVNAKKSTSTTFTVRDVTRGSDTYSPGANTDSDGDSNGTFIEVRRV